MTALHGVDLVEGRHRAYALLGEALVNGLTEPVFERLGALPALHDVLPSAPSDEEAAAFHEATSLDVFPFESVFVDPEGLLEGPTTATVAEAYRAAGFHPDTRSRPADHVGVELAFLAHLCAAEADALRDGADEAVSIVRAHAAAFLDAHLLRWLPALVVAWDTQAGCPWVARLGHLALELAVSHRGAGGAEIAALPSATLDLDDANTRLADIVRYLVRPAASGWFLSRRGIARLAQRIDLPTGFGPRARMLEQVVFTAVDARVVPALVEALEAEVREVAEGLQALARIGADVSPWTAALVATQATLARIASALETQDRKSDAP